MPIYESRTKRFGRAIPDPSTEGFAPNLTAACAAAISVGFVLEQVTVHKYELRAGDIGTRFTVDSTGRFLRAYPLLSNDRTFRTVRKMRLSIGVTDDQV